MKVCGNCLWMVSYNVLFDFGRCRLHGENRLYTSGCADFKDHYSLDELKRIEEKRRSKR